MNPSRVIGHVCDDAAYTSSACGHGHQELRNARGAPVGFDSVILWSLAPFVMSAPVVDGPNEFGDGPACLAVERQNEGTCGRQGARVL